MLEKIREGSQGKWAIVILGLVILSFVFAGVGGYVSSSSGVAAAEVNGDEIPQSTLERAYENERARLESQFGEAFSALAADANYLSEFRQGILDRLIGDKLIEQTAEELGLRVSDQQILEEIRGMESFQLGGQFNNDRYLDLIRSSGFQPAAFRDYMRSEMTRQQVARALLGSEFALSSEAKEIFALQQQTRDIKFISVPSAPFNSEVTNTDEEVQAYYQKNLAQFDTEEKVSVSYVELTLDDLLPLVTVNEEELQQAYEQAAADYKTPEQRRASHILVEFGEDKDAALERAQAALAKVQGGAAFEDVAKSDSDDTFSAENGGDLDYFVKEDMDPAFSEAAYSLQNVGDVSDVVESEFGFHVIKLTDVTPEQVTPYEEVKADLEQNVKREKAIEEFYVIQQNIAEVAFEVPDSLEEVAAAANKPVNTTDLFTRNSAPQEINNPVVLASAFSDELILEGVNSDVLEMGENHIVVIRVAQHEPERTRTLEEVSADIQALLVAEKSQQAAKQWASEMLAALEAGEDITAKLEEKGLTWETQEKVARFGSTVANEIVEKSFQLSTNSENNRAVVELASGDVGIVQLDKINAGEEVPEEQVARLQQRLAEAKSQGMYRSLIEALKADADIKIYKL